MNKEYKEKILKTGLEGFLIGVLSKPAHRIGQSA